MTLSQRLMVVLAIVTTLGAAWVVRPQPESDQSTACRLVHSHVGDTMVFCPSPRGAYLQPHSPFSLQGRLAPYIRHPNATQALSGQELLTLGLPIDINTAREDDLMALPGIGPGRARAIVTHRRLWGTFDSIHDLQRVRGIGPATISSLTGLITTEEEQ